MMKIMFEVDVERKQGAPSNRREIEEALSFVFTTYEFVVLNKEGTYSTYDIVSAKARA